MMKTCVHIGTLGLVLASCISSEALGEGDHVIEFFDEIIRQPGQIWDVANYPYLMEQVGAGEDDFGFILSTFSAVTFGSGGYLGIMGANYGSSEFDVKVSYEDSDGLWHSYDEHIDGDYGQWIGNLLDGVDYQSIIVTTSVDPRLELQLPGGSVSSVPGVPAPGGVCLLALAGMSATRRRR
ncbi:MAG: hypothetical protein KDA29_12445 [Phycisphaerales bacterium]|nr:hypothetical protein [Phycisphaerales bacterium]